MLQTFRIHNTWRMQREIFPRLTVTQSLDSGNWFRCLRCFNLVCRRRGTTALWGESRLSTNINVLTFKESLVHPWQNISSLCNSLASSTYVLASSWGLGASAAGSSLETKVHPRLLAESLWAWKSWDALMHTSLKSEICHQGFLKKWCRGTRWLP